MTNQEIIILLEGLRQDLFRLGDEAEEKRLLSASDAYSDGATGAQEIIDKIKASASNECKGLWACDCMADKSISLWVHPGYACPYCNEEKKP